MEKLVLIDGNSLINRAFYAMPLLSTKIGTPTNAVYGFMNMFFKILGDIKPKYVAVAFDLKAPTFRHKMFDGYKATRKPMPEDLRPQLPLLKDLLKLMNVRIIEKEGIEADDIIGTIAKHTDILTYIFTGDKDSLQLVDEQTEVHFTKRGITETEIYTAQNFKEKTGLFPSQIIELKALMGDSSDNIPGVFGVGEKSALSLLDTYHDIDGVYANTHLLKGKLQEKIVADKENAYLSRTLATINCDCDVDTDVSNMTISLPFSLDVRKKFIELEFKSLYKRDEWFESSDENADKNEEILDYSPAKTITVNDFGDVVQKLSQSLAAIIVTDLSINVSNGKEEFIFPIKRTLLDEGFSLSQVLLYLEPLFSGKNPIILYDKKEFRHFIKKSVNLDLSCPCEDVCIIKYLADYSGKKETFAELCLEYGFPSTSPATSLFFAYKLLVKKLAEEEQERLYYDLELPLADVLYDMEVAGFKVEKDILSQAGEKYKAELDKIESEIRTFAQDDTLNVNSSKQLGDVLFEKLKIGKGKKNKHGYSTTAEILEGLEDAHPIVPLILKYRGIQKLYSTYIEGFKPLIEENTGLIHTSFNQTVTSTGRLSSKEPNLQNIPVRDDEGREIRKFFVAKSSDRVLISADYSQIELRLLAAFSNCTALIDGFKNERDIHKETASKVFNVPIEEVTSLMRSNAKAVNFGIIYGISEYGLAKNIKTSPALAREYIKSYFNEYPEVKKYMDENVEFAKQTGYAQTMLKRKRYIRELLSSNYMTRQFGERAAMNMPLQGSSADIIKLAMLGVSKRLKEEGLKSELILQIHDELIVDAFISEQEKVEKILIEEMEGAVKLSVPLTVGLGSGKTWFDAK